MIPEDRCALGGILGFAGDILCKYGPRITGTGACRAAAGDIASALRPHCDAVAQEAFALHPGALYHMGRVVSAAYILTVALMASGGAFTVPACAVSLLALAYATIHYLLYGHTFDRLFRRAEGRNVVASIEPEKPAERQVIVSAHIDSAYVFNFVSRFPKLAGIRFLLAMAFYLYATVLSCAAAVSFVSAGAWHVSQAALITALAGAFFALPLFFFISRKPAPGASDDLIGCAIAASLAERFGSRKPEGRALRRTRIVFLIADGEEAGQCGSQAYVKRHGRELHSMPTRVINLDSIYSLADLAVLKSDGHGFVPLSRQMAAELAALAVRLGYNMEVKGYPFGGGGTDAASFAKAGIEAVSVIAMPTSLFHGKHVYHTPNDTIDCIEPGAAEAVFDIVANSIVMLDNDSHAGDLKNG